MAAARRRQAASCAVAVPCPAIATACASTSGDSARRLSILSASSRKLSSCGRGEHIGNLRPLPLPNGASCPTCFVLGRADVLTCWREMMLKGHGQSGLHSRCQHVGENSIGRCKPVELYLVI